MIGLLLHPLRIIDRRVRLDADEDILRRSVVLVAVVHIVGRHQREIELLCQRDHFPVGIDLLLETVILQLDKEPLASEDLGQCPGILVCLFRLVIEEVVGNRATETRGRGDDAFVVLLQHLHVDPGPVIEPVKSRLAGKLQKVLVTLLVLRQQQQVI